MSELLCRFLDTNGDGTGTKNANGDYSLAAETFYIEASAYPLAIARLIVSAEDTTGMQAQEYGNLGAALGNGITIQHLRGTDVVTDFTDGVPVTTNANWGRFCYDAEVKSWGAGNELLLVRWTFEKSGSMLRLLEEDSFVVTLNDDLTGLLSHYFLVQGYFPG